MTGDGIADHPKANPGCPMCDGGGILDHGENLCAVFVACVCTGEASEDVIKALNENHPDKLRSMLILERTGNIFSIASTEFEVMYPDGHIGTIWSPPWHEMADEEEDEAALEAAWKFWLAGTHKIRGAKQR